MANSTFGGLCVLALESRRAREIAKLIANLGGVPIVAPSVQRSSLGIKSRSLGLRPEDSSAREVDMVIFTTGVGVKALASAVEKACPRDELSRYLNEMVVVARGPKPTAALKELGVRVSISVPEPNTWRDLLTVLDQSKNTFPVAGRRIAVQEYGVTNPELSAGLEERGAIVTPVNVYQWALPEDLSPLQKAVESIISGDVHVLLVASSVQIRHLFEVAERMAKSEPLHEALVPGGHYVRRAADLGGTSQPRFELSTSSARTLRWDFWCRRRQKKAPRSFVRNAGQHPVANRGAGMSTLYPLFLNLQGRVCVVVGGNEMAEGKGKGASGCGSQGPRHRSCGHRQDCCMVSGRKTGMGRSRL